MSYTYQIGTLSAAYDAYLKDKSCKDKELDAFFDGFHLGQESALGENPVDAEAYRLIQMYRHFGYMAANTNPLKETKQASILQIQAPFSKDSPLARTAYFNTNFETLGELEAFLKKIYTSSIGYQFLHTEKKVIDFIRNRIEKKQEANKILEDLHLYDLIAKAEGFENFLHTRFPGQKRFSLEGLESGLPLAMEVILQAEKNGFNAAFFGMAHRGRLNFLANLFQKPISLIFSEFSKDFLPNNLQGLGDVKYHMGAYHQMEQGFELYLSSNPSHLEAVDPVIQGMSYAYLRNTKKKPLTVLIHGDASFAGQGVVYESIQMGQIKGFCSSGSLHIIFNNQIGFTALPSESRSTFNSSDLAKTFNMPIFQINAEDIDAIQQISELSVELISSFGIDVMIELIGFRRFGHNESDEPMFTQPLLYKAIKEKKSILSIFRNSLLEKNPSLDLEIKKIDDTIKEKLQEAFSEKTKESVLSFKKVSNPSHLQPCDLSTIGQKLFSIPQGFAIHPKLLKLFEERNKICENKLSVDYPTAELLALGFCLYNKGAIRFVGQDSQRGTFSQRHAVLIDQETEERYNIFSSINEKNLPCEFINSPLSEYAVLGFEYGFSKGSVHEINVWEAQFGDFANGAQIIIDQFIASGKTKWDETSNLILMLPHGYEGQGPEHTSGRIERFLELAAEDNMRICIPTYPSQIFHLIKEQLNAKKPLILFTPKALLRLPECKDTFDTLEHGNFDPITCDGNQEATVCVLTYGKLYFDLIARKKEKNLSHISLIRLDQLYPLDEPNLKRLISAKKACKKVVLIQDEPKNMGAYYYLKAKLKDLELISRKEASSPASGFYQMHDIQLKEILTQFENL